MEKDALQTVAKNNPEVILGWIKAELASGKFLVMSEFLYDKAIPILKEAGWTEEDYKNIHKSVNLKVN